MVVIWCWGSLEFCEPSSLCAAFPLSLFPLSPLPPSPLSSFLPPYLSLLLVVVVSPLSSPWINLFPLYSSSPLGVHELFPLVCDNCEGNLVLGVSSPFLPLIFPLVLLGLFPLIYPPIIPPCFPFFPFLGGGGGGSVFPLESPLIPPIIYS